MAGAHAVVIQITGKGGHAAMPHTTADPVVAGAMLLNKETHKMQKQQQGGVCGRVLKYFAGP